MLVCLRGVTCLIFLSNLDLFGFNCNRSIKGRDFIFQSFNIISSSQGTVIGNGYNTGLLGNHDYLCVARFTHPNRSSVSCAKVL